MWPRCVCWACRAQLESFRATEDAADKTDLEALRELTAALLEESSLARRHAEASRRLLEERVARLELRSPGVEQFASVDDLSEFRGSANNMCKRVYDAHKLASLS